jgi:hypothetical protein
MLSTIELKEIKQQIDKGYSVSFPYTTLKEYLKTCKQIDDYLEYLNRVTYISIEEI